MTAAVEAIISKIVKDIMLRGAFCHIITAKAMTRRIVKYCKNFFTVFSSIITGDSASRISRVKNSIQLLTLMMCKHYSTSD